MSSQNFQVEGKRLKPRSCFYCCPDLCQRDFHKFSVLLTIFACEDSTTDTNKSKGSYNPHRIFISLRMPVIYIFLCFPVQLNHLQQKKKKKMWLDRLRSPCQLQSISTPSKTKQYNVTTKTDYICCLVVDLLGPGGQVLPSF